MKPIDEYSAEPTPEELECNLRMIGLLGLSDLLRPDSKDAVNECKSAGMKVVMLTGDRKKALPLQLLLRSALPKPMKVL